MAAMAGSGSSGGTPAPRAGAGPTVIAAALVVLVIGLGWLNHGGSAVDQGSTPFARDVSQAVEQAQEDGLIPASQPAQPSDIGSSRSGDDGGGDDRTSSTTIVVDPETGLEITINVESGTTGSSGTTGGSTGTTGGGDGTTSTSRPGSPTTRPTTPPTTDPTTTTTEPTTTTTEPTTTTTETPPTTGLLEDLVGGLTGALGSVVGAVF